eukprot:scaffold12741_cov59-Phaeocystis_antarctica.AAC.1
MIRRVHASFDALEAGGTVEGLFDFMGRLRGRPFAVRCFVVQVFLIVLFFARRALSAVFGIVRPTTALGLTLALLALTRTAAMPSS